MIFQRKFHAYIVVFTCDFTVYGSDSERFLIL